MSNAFVGVIALQKVLFTKKTLPLAKTYVIFGSNGIISLRYLAK